MYSQPFTSKDFTTIEGGTDAVRIVPTRNCHTISVFNSSPYHYLVTDQREQVITIIPPYTHVVDRITQPSDELLITSARDMAQSSVTAASYAVYVIGIQDSLPSAVDGYAL